MRLSLRVYKAIFIFGYPSHPFQLPLVCAYYCSCDFTARPPTRSELGSLRSLVAASSQRNLQLGIGSGSVLGNASFSPHSPTDAARSSVRALGGGAASAAGADMDRVSIIYNSNKTMIARCFNQSFEFQRN
jgi:hypothetical protein